MKKEKLKVDFVDFWPNFIKTDNYFYHLLSQEYDVSIEETIPDILFHSVDYFNQRNHLRYNNGITKKVYFTAEPPHIHRPDYTQTHFSFGYEDTGDARNYRLPLWILHLNWFDVPHNDDRDQSYLHPLDEFLKPKDPERILNEKKAFCSFVNTQPFGKRVEFVPKLHSKRFVHCAGRMYNNTNGNIIGRGDQRWKIEYLNNFKFNISMENCPDYGYVSEKIIHSMFANCIPIYWGSNAVINDFNEKSFINWHMYEDDELVVEKIIELDDNKELYFEILSQPWFTDNKVPEFAKPESVLNFIKNTILK